MAHSTGVDPAIIATIASTESNLGLAPPFTLGITTAATRGGRGSSGGVLRSSSSYAGTSQPAAFWSYENGAEAAKAFADYIHGYQPGLANLLGDAQKFFDPSGPIITSNYYVPTPGGTPTATYYANWKARAAQVTSSNGNEIVNWLRDHGIAVPDPGQSPHPMPGQPGGVVTPPGDYNPPAGSISQGVGDALGGLGTSIQSGLDQIGQSIQNAIASLVLSFLHVLLALLFIAMTLLGLYFLLTN